MKQTKYFLIYLVIIWNIFSLELQHFNSIFRKVRTSNRKLNLNSFPHFRGAKVHVQQWVPETHPRGTQQLQLTELLHRHFGIVYLLREIWMK